MGPDEPGGQTGGSGGGPSFGPGVVINSESQKMLAKIARKEQRRTKGAGTQMGEMGRAVGITWRCGAFLTSSQDLEIPF